MMNVIIIPMLSDNFSYYVYKGDNIDSGFLVDASETDKVKAFQKTFSLANIKHLLTTHKHQDHSGAN
jgi:glyoxylase-like metal-dependent hydrolase (beta-lactamase superfamily II)